MDQEAHEQMNNAREFGQGHLFSFWNELDEKQQQQLLSQVQTIDVARIERLYNTPQPPPSTTSIKPPRLFTPKQASEQAREQARKAYVEGRVAVVLLAGGQASRMGLSGPKGTVPIMPVTKKTLFEVFSQKLLHTTKVYGSQPEFYVMTSDENHEETVEYFRANNYFGLDKERVVFFPQSMLPVVDQQGLILLSDKHTLCQAPAGHGGVYRALKKAKLFTRMSKHNIHYMITFQIDNPLSYVDDSSFLGLHIEQGSDMSSKVVEKEYPQERVGLLVNKDGKTMNLEYIHLPEDYAYARDNEGRLLYRAANVANHIINTSFAEHVALGELPVYHAQKKVSCIDEHADHVTPIEPNAIKFESFIFDALLQANTTMTMMVQREEEFAPVKNAHGKDSPESAQLLIVNQAKKWLRAAGIEKSVVNKVDRVEISPLLAANQDEFVKNTTAHLAHMREQLLRAKGKGIYFS